MSGDEEYYRRRAEAEWAAVAAATCDAARIAHSELAKRYVDLAKNPRPNVVFLNRDEEPALPRRAQSAEG